MARFTATHSATLVTARRAPTSASALTRKKRAYCDGGLYFSSRVSKSVVNGETARRYRSPKPSCTTQNKAMKNTMTGSVPTSWARRSRSQCLTLSPICPPSAKGVGSILTEPFDIKKFCKNGPDPFGL